MTGDEYDSDDDDAKTIYHDETILDESDDEGAFQSQAWEPMKFLPGAEESESTRFQLQKLPETVFQSFPPPQNEQHWDQQETWFVLYANCMYIQFAFYPLRISVTTSPKPSYSYHLSLLIQANIGMSLFN